jgi:hypothetical protein
VLVALDIKEKVKLLNTTAVCPTGPTTIVVGTAVAR